MATTRGPLVGSDIKISIGAEVGGLSLSDFTSFSVEVIGNRGKQVIHQNEMIDVSDGTCLAVVNTDITGVGVLTLVMHAVIPDDDFPDGRREVASTTIDTSLWGV